MATKRSRIDLKRMHGKIPAQIKRGENGEITIRTQSTMVIPLAILEGLVIATLMTLNYLFRYDATLRFNSDMSYPPRVLLPCDESMLKYELNRPYFDYEVNASKDLEGLELSYELPEWVFFLCSLLTPVLIFCVVEGFRAQFALKRKREIETFGIVIPDPVLRIVRILGSFFLGGAISGVFVSVMKFNMISARPHFGSVCASNDTDFQLPAACFNQSLWNPFLECPNLEEEQILEALKSFPSYHAALAVYSGVYTSAYLNFGQRTREFSAMSMLFQLGIFSMTLIGATHRLSSGYSFPRDIFVGSFIGAAVASFMVKNYLNGFRNKRVRVKLDSASREKAYSMRKQQEQDSGAFSSDVTDSDFDSDSISEEYKSTVSIIDSLSFIPRVSPDRRSEPMQAVNPTMNINRNKPSVPPKPPVPPPLPHSKNAPIRSSSSVAGRTWHGNNSYNVPRQRNSAPSNRHEPPGHNGYNGYTNNGYRRPHQDAPRSILSAYDPPAVSEASSYF